MSPEGSMGEGKNAMMEKIQQTHKAKLDIVCEHICM